MSDIERLNDRELRGAIERARHRDPDAWEQLYRHCYRRLFGFAVRRLGSAPAAEDAVSETMLRALSKIDTFRWEGAGFDAWMYGIARNVVLESHRSTSKASELSKRVLQEPSESAVIDLTEPSERLIKNEERVEVQAAFDRLETNEQEILELRIVGGLSASEVGSVVGKQAGAVRMAQSRALGRLRSFIGEFDNA